MKPPWVLGVGDADVDIYLNVPHIPERDEKVLAGQVGWYPGGMVANFLVALRRLGTACGFHGPVGDDEFGRITLADLAENGVTVDAGCILPGERTYFCVVMLDESGERALIVAPTRAIFPQPGDLDETMITQADHVHTTGANMATTLRVAELVHAHGHTLSIDLEPTMATTAQLEQLLPLVTILFINHRAVAGLAPGYISLDKAAQAIVTRGPRLVCITLGAEGSWVADASGAWHTPAFRVPVIDTTGAGDCFAAAFVHTWLQGMPLPQAARFASAAAALSIGGRGGHGAAPTAAQVEEFIENHDRVTG